VNGAGTGAASGSAAAETELIPTAAARSANKNFGAMVLEEKRRWLLMMLVKIAGSLQTLYTSMESYHELE
jgi:hypothetical protein